MLDIRNYVICFVVEQHEYFLVWQTGPGDDPDRLLSMPDGEQLLIAGSEEELALLADEREVPLEVDDPYVYDLDRLFGLLGELPSDASLDIDSCKLLLDCWNMLEDMAKTLGLALTEMEEGKADILDTVYGELFHGNNLPSITPEGESFEPVFSAEEIQAMRAYLAGMWAELYALNRGFWRE